MKKSLFVFISLSLILSVNCRTYGQTDKAPFTSSVPKFTFSDSLDRQEEELKSNVIIKRFIESRKKLAQDPYRPIYHFGSPESRLGDPNGLCFWQGRWHIFYQGFPAEDRRQHWGHAVSDDLIHWKDLPYAIYPGPEQKVYSGSTLVEDNRVIAMYHGTGEGNMIAISSDPLLLNWKKISGSAVIPSRSSTGFPLPYSVFDPCIWKRDSVYYSLSGGKRSIAGGMTAGAAYLFRSRDLIKWEFMHQFVEGDRFSLTGDDFASPYFWPIGNRYILYFFSHMSRGQFLLGDYDTAENKFNVTQGSGHSGIGPPTATPDGNGGVIVMANLGGYFTIPRRVTLLNNSEVHQEPAGDLASLHFDPEHLENIKLPANKEVVFKNIKGNTTEISAEFDMKNSQMIEMNVLRSPKNEEYTRIIVYKEKDFNYKGLNYISTSESASMPADLVPLFTDKKIQPQPARALSYSIISVETENASSAPDARFAAPLSLPFLLNPGETLKLRVFIDKSIVEVFVNGRQALCISVRPSRKESIGVSVKSRGGDAELMSIDSWQMHSIY
jgi:beta-fructofuranosidase